MWVLWLALVALVALLAGLYNAHRASQEETERRLGYLERRVKMIENVVAKQADIDAQKEVV